MAFITGLLMLSSVTLIRAQEPATQLTPTDAQTTEQQEKKEAAEKKAMALLEQIVGEVQLLKLPENRIRVQIAAADMLWKGNEERARCPTIHLAHPSPLLRRHLRACARPPGFPK